MNFCLLASHYGNDEEFKKYLKMKQKIIMGMIVLGIFSLGAGYYIGVTMAAGSNSDHTSGFFCGIGTGLIGAAIVLFIRNAKIIRDNKRLHAERIKAEDERNKSIVQKSATMTILFMILISYIGMIIASFYSRMVMMTLWSVIMGMVVIYLLCNLVIRKLM